MINTVNYSLEEGEAGILLSFVVNPNQIRPRDRYVVSFDSPVSLPYNPPVKISFEPDTASYTVSGNSPLRPKINVKIKSLHRAETRTLIRLTIKDVYNTVLYIDYILVICSPQSTIKFEGGLLPSSPSSNLGDNGFSLIRLTQPNTGRLDVGMTVAGPGLAVTKTYTIKTIISTDTIEISENVGTFDNRVVSGTFTFTRSTACTDPTSLVLRDTQPVYVILDFFNNWTYMAGNRVIAQFIVENKENNLDTVVLLPIKNASLLNDPDQAANIPLISIVKAGGRVINDTQCISEIVFS